MIEYKNKMDHHSSVGKSGKALVFILGLIAGLVLGFLISFFIVQNISKSFFRSLETIENAQLVMPASEEKLGNTSMQGAQDNCTFDYFQTPESQIVNEENPVLILGFEKKCDGNYYLLLDYLSPGDEDPNTDIGFFSNTSFNVRTFQLSPLAKIGQGGRNNQISVDEFISSLVLNNGKLYGQNGFYVSNALDRQAVFRAMISEGMIVSLDALYLP